MLFPFSEYYWFYIIFTLFIIFILCLDLGVFHKEHRPVKIKEAALWTVIWILLAFAFNYFLYIYAQWSFGSNNRLTSLPGFDPQAAAWQTSIEFLTGFIIEKSLAVDNIFVFVIVFSLLSIPPKYQHRVLFYGIIGALLFRAILIAAGSVLIQYHWVVVFFGVLLILTGVKTMLAKKSAAETSENKILQFLSKHLPVTKQLHGHKFILRHQGKIMLTPLMLALILIEISDIIFAFDSVPAIFAITKEPLIVFTSNIFAILGLRSLYFLLGGALHLFPYIKYGLGLVLVFVGLKMVWLNELFDGKFPVIWSLLIIMILIAGSMILPLLFTRLKALGAYSRKTAEEQRN